MTLGAFQLHSFRNKFFSPSSPFTRALFFLFFNDEDTSVNNNNNNKGIMNRENEGNGGGKKNEKRVNSSVMRKVLQLA